MPTPPKANRIQPSTGDVGQRLDDFRPNVEGELGSCLERALRMHKAETIGAAVDRKRSTIYRWAANPEDVPLSVVPALAEFDSDPDFLARIAGHLLAHVSSAALSRAAAGKAITIIHELGGTGKWGR